MDTMKPMLEGGTLDSVLQCATQRALACGALQPIESALHVIEDGGVHFLVRQLSPLGASVTRRWMLAVPHRTHLPGRCSSLDSAASQWK